MSSTQPEDRVGASLADHRAVSTRMAVGFDDFAGVTGRREAVVTELCLSHETLSCARVEKPKAQC